MNLDTSSSLPSNDLDQAQRRKRSKEELEALAQNFIGAPTAAEPARALPKRTLLIGGGIAAAAVLVLAVVALWPEAQEAQEAPAARQAKSDRAAQQAEELRRKFEAERERARQALQANSDYMNRIAQADSALVKDMQSRAVALAARSAEPAAGGNSSGVPTPKDERKVAASAPAPAKPAAPTPAPATATASTQEPARPAPQQAQPAAPQQQVASAAPATAQARPASCKIHVSELSSSGKLTYDAVKNMKGAHTDARTGHVFTPPVKTGSTTVVFEVMQDGCVNVVRGLR